MKKIFYCLIALYFFQSCRTSATLQTAKPLGKKNSEMLAGVEAVHFSDLKYEDYAFAEVLPSVVFSMRYGIAPKIDLGILFHPSTSMFQPDIKYNIWSSRNERIYLSAGLRFRFGLMNKYFLEKTLSAPVYLSFGNHDRCAFYLSYRFGMWPNYFRFMDEYDSPQYDFVNERKGTLHAHAGAVGIKFGKPTPHVYIEISGYRQYFYELIPDFPTKTMKPHYREFNNAQLNIAWVLKNKKDKKSKKEKVNKKTNQE